MHILFVSQYFPPEIGATQTRMHEFARAAQGRGHRVTVLTEFPNHPHGKIPDAYRGRRFSHELMDGLAVERVWVHASPVKTSRTRLLSYVSFMLMATARGLLIRGPLDIVVATSPPLPVGLAGWLVAKRHRARFILDVRDLWPDLPLALGELRSPILLRGASLLERFLYARANVITAVTRSFVAAIKTRAPRGKSVVHLPNGAADVFAPTEAKPHLRAELGFSDEFVVTFAGNLGIAQGLDSVLAAAAILEGRAVFCFIGEGPVKAELRARTAERGLNNVRFFPAVPTSEIVPFLLASDALLVALGDAPILEMFVPSKLFDCLACAKPVILMASGESRDILVESGGGLSVRPGDVQGLAAAVTRLARLSDPERVGMGQRGRAYVVTHYTRAIQNARMLDLIEEGSLAPR